MILYTCSIGHHPPSQGEASAHSLINSINTTILGVDQEHFEGKKHFESHLLMLQTTTTTACQQKQKIETRSFLKKVKSLTYGTALPARLVRVFWLERLREAQHHRLYKKPMSVTLAGSTG